MKKSSSIVLKEFFGYLPTNSTKGDLTSDEVRKLPYDEGVRVGGIKGFAVELGRLNADEKLELARAAAQALGYTQEQLDFPLA